MLTRQHTGRAALKPRHRQALQARGIMRAMTPLSVLDLAPIVEGSDAATALHHTLDLPGGSLLLMRGLTQRHWQHALPKTARPVAPRLNLTFRWVAGAAG